MVMDPEEEHYDPDCDVFRFLNPLPDPSLDTPFEGLMLSPHAEPLPALLSFTPQLVAPLSDHSMVLDGSTYYTIPVVESRTSTNIAPVLPVMGTVKPVPLSVEGVIISAMERVQIHEGSSSSTTTARPADDCALYGPIFERCLRGQKDCSCCVILRELTHSSPNRNLIFTVHGGLGTFDHAVFDVEYFTEGGHELVKRELFYVDLSRRSHDWVKQFMIGCVAVLQTDTSGTTKDSLTSFYDTLCADMNYMTPIEATFGIDYGPAPTLCFEDFDDCFSQLPSHFEVGESSRTREDVLNDSQNELPTGKEPIVVIPTTTTQISVSGSTSVSAVSPTIATANSVEVTNIPSENHVVAEDTQRDINQRRPTRTALALQRERTANMGLFELASYLHLPMIEAARRLRVCSTALKHICRRNGLARWPSRQLQAIDNKIAKLELDMVRGNRRGGLYAIRDAIEALQMKKTAIYEKMLNF